MKLEDAKKEKVPMAKSHRYNDMRFDVMDYFTMNL